MSDAQIPLIDLGLIRVNTRGPTLAWAPVPELPLAEPSVWDGHRIEWGDWDVAPLLTHIENECEACGYDGQPWMSHAIQHPNPADTFRSTRTRRLKSGREYEVEADVPAWPVVRVFAFLCPACGHLSFYDQLAGRDPS